MTAMITVPCWELYVWRGHWQLRSRFDTPGEARLAFLMARRRERFARFRVVESTRKVATFTQPAPPTDAQRFRESQSERMVVRRQAFSYYKSGSNGTEVPQPMPESQ